MRIRAVIIALSKETDYSPQPERKERGMNMLKNTMKAMLLTLAVSGSMFVNALQANAKSADSYFWNWMYDITMTTDVLQEIDHNLDREWMSGTMVDENFELFEDTYGTLTIMISGSDLFVYGHLNGWYWNSVVTDTRYDTILQSMKETFGEPIFVDSDIPGVTEIYEYKGPAFTEGTYDPVNWTMTGSKSSTPVPFGNYFTKDELLSIYHSIFLFRTGNKISIQYYPINFYNHTNYRYYSNGI